MSLTEADKARRLAQPRFNERVKLIVTSLDAIALAILGAAFILPGTANVANLLSIESWFCFSLLSAYILEHRRSSDA